MAQAEFSLATETAERLGGAEAVGREVRCDADLADAVEAGLPTESLRALVQGGVTDHELSTLVITQRTLSQRRATGARLTIDESDRAARLARTLALADRTFANPEKARHWMHKELHVLGGRRPIDLIRTQAGTRVVEDELARIAWGVPA